MTTDKGIPIKNIYYMLTYAFQVLRQSHYSDIAAEDFQNTEDLFAAILATGLAQQVKQGLRLEYTTQHKTLTMLRGKLDVQETIKEQPRRKQTLSCRFDELSEDNLCNRILKTTASILSRTESVSPQRRAALRKVLMYLDSIAVMDPRAIPWAKLRLQRSSRTYQMLLCICQFILDSLLPTTEPGRYHMAAFSDDHMARLYERFILEYYRRHHTYLQADALQVKWALDPNADTEALRFLPMMQTDIALRCGGKTLIIDAKYYTDPMQSQHGSHTLRSGNLYQIFAYVKNMDPGRTGSVSGMLLYAKTESAISPDWDFSMSGNQISAKTLDLSTDFSEIARQLDGIAESVFGKFPCTAQ
ncbi:MAG: 5-methylcytosine-specific restriction endonuclease system specificity protein McrC [Ruminococcaceae bacterium]|nr:5-methylcytosine-specific restriction endonuclease system specificity protein McrC [Oscillospiraceae bacterium]